MRDSKYFFGVTLLELMIVIAVIGILATIAYPSLQNLIRDGRVVSQANELAAMITYAHSQATQGIPQVSIEVDPGLDWGATLRGRNSLAGPSVILRQMDARNTNLFADGQLPIVVNNRGLVISGPVCFDIQHTPGDQARSVAVRVSGQVLVQGTPCP